MEIYSLKNEEGWRYVNTYEIHWQTVYREVSPKVLKNNIYCLLRNSLRYWCCKLHSTMSFDKNMEFNKQMVVSSPIVDNVSTFTKLQRVVANMLRFRYKSENQKH